MIAARPRSRDFSSDSGRSALGINETPAPNGAGVSFVLKKSGF